MKSVKIVGTGSYIPERVVSAEDIDRLIGKNVGWTSKNIGIERRRYSDKTVSYMAKEAILKALEVANVDREEIGIICYTGVSFEQPIPATACLIQKKLEVENTEILTLDINSSCISFLTAIDMVSGMLDRYRYAVIVSSEKGSECINYNEPESSALFGDGAAAMVLTLDETKNSKLIHSKYKTYVEGLRYCEIYGGGSKMPPNLKNLTVETEELYKFHMDGPKVYRMASKYLPKYMEEFFDECKLKLEDVDVVVPHQTSKSSLDIMGKKLGIPDEKMINIIRDYGNMISASIPFAFDCGIKNGSIKRGDKILLIGTAAGFSIGGILIEY